MNIFEEACPMSLTLAALISLSLLTGVPTSQLAAVQQYQQVPIAAEKWVGSFNPNRADQSPATITYYGGFGRDGDGDGKADAANPIDRAASWSNYLQTFGTAHEQFKQAIWHFYQNDRSVTRVLQFEKIYRTAQLTTIDKTVFPLPYRTHYTYKGTWGAPRGYGGRRTHEGTDLFADYGLPVRSVRYGIVEVKGWNRMGGWRIGVRDLNNNYHYFAHLSGFNKNLHVGSVVAPGTIVGWVGSSGYGNTPGTSGKFPPHLHYGLYRDNGYVDWSMDPYPYLRRWELQERQAPTRSHM
jgi:murein DD-endopeptidase MepM/ murein hydrolase activator NlpD